MSDGIWIKYDELSAVNEKLKSIVSELDDAGSKTDAVQDAIGYPFGRDALRRKAGDFESRWDSKRSDLSRDIKKVQEHVQGVLDGCAKWDEETAKGMEVDATGEHGSRKAA
ncbi:MAG: flagellar protein FlgN [Actinobacteria bacterium]|nr:flagellar protein FlgN [Actinomycetota bacterium]